MQSVVTTPMCKKPLTCFAATNVRDDAYMEMLPSSAPVSIWDTAGQTSTIFQNSSLKGGFKGTILKIVLFRSRQEFISYDPWTQVVSGRKGDSDIIVQVSVSIYISSVNVDAMRNSLLMFVFVFYKYCRKITHVALVTRSSALKIE